MVEVKQHLARRTVDGVHNVVNLGRRVQQPVRPILKPAHRLDDQDQSVGFDHLGAVSEEVDARRPTAAVQTAARSALKYGYVTELCVVNVRDEEVGRQLLVLEKAGAVLVRKGSVGSRDGDCVSILAWPGPRVRNELRISGR